MIEQWQVLKINVAETYDWLKRVHYAKRVPQIVHAFALYDAQEMLGIVTYGIPSSAPLREGIAGKQHSQKILELNRLVFAEPVKNGASYLVARSLAMLPKPSIVVSYADTAQGHIGYVYQACNFVYTGLSAKRTDWKVKGLEHLHGQTIADISKSATGQGRGSRAQFMRDKFGDDFYLEDRARKHRYIYIVGNRFQKRDLLKEIKYPLAPYPKGDARRYEITAKPETQSIFEFE